MDVAFVVGGGLVGAGRVHASVKSEFVCSAPYTRRVAQPKRPVRWFMGKQASFGPFTPAVIATRLVIGEKRFNKLRGKGISLHSQVITNLCTYVGAGPKTKQGLIRLAKNNGNKLGFLS
mmetsp:Transcript_5393/g.11364  ORF Transcript_5393/g.11364 Transcript_5393/m.11364 type:complete len:119 (-) Transcript_5393:259-615(-)|eukprot:CAMPEP_0185856564 /NCGR_PEP_ID=MMETSP1354-20130828/29066_1 /TAXON_ID=708628 /ORGANISM="Erythrolobus madagascarensis, Strain CCMP3276" /LENGTH=118 /DNA_ID=CAMNT_0028558825 /DNA_START=89 /DNA_END=448 /DNA_ORIENTATION=+